MRSDLIGCMNSHVKYMLENKHEIERYIREIEEEKFSDFVNSQSENEILPEYKEIDEMKRNNFM